MPDVPATRTVADTAVTHVADHNTIADTHNAIKAVGRILTRTNFR